MRLLLLSDSQADFGNLDQCQTSIDEVLESANKYSPDAIIHAGDLKDAYNPVDIRLVKHWVRVTRQIVDAGYRFIVLLGNHDRISQSFQSKNWLDILRAAGAETVVSFKSKRVGDGQVYFMPFTSNKKLEKEWAIELMQMRNEHAPRNGRKDKAVLIFHTEVAGAVLNASGAKARGITLEDLRASEYAACFGGHIHRHQRLDKNVWFIGSPFCHDWSEANETKGHLIVDVDERVKVKQIETSIPHWYTEEWLYEQGANVGAFRPEDGAYIRSHVEVTSKKVTDQIREEEQRLKKAYGDKVRLFIVPKLVQSEDLAVKLEGSTDKAIIEQYVAATMPEEARYRAEVAVGYLTKAIGSTNAPQVSNERLDICRVAGKNVLSYKILDMDLEKQGLVLIRGDNKDWPGRSNGAGKSAALGMIPIALFGRTLKDQKHDQWAREGSEDEAVVTLMMRDAAGRTIIVERARPHRLILDIDGNDVSTGIRGTGKDETQGLIEKTIGFDLRTMLNSVYIDQSIANGFVFGTQKDRMDLVSKLQNVERYEAAQKVVKADIDHTGKSEAEIAVRVESLEDEVTRLEQDLKEVDETPEPEWGGSLEEYQKEFDRLSKVVTSQAAFQKTYEGKQTELDELVHDLTALKTKFSKVASDIQYWDHYEDHARKLIEQGKCENCGQQSVDAGERQVKFAGGRLKSLAPEADKLKDSIAEKERRYQKFKKEIDYYNTELAQARIDLQHGRELLAQAKQGNKEKSKYMNHLAKKRQEIQNKLNQVQRNLKAARSALTTAAIDREMLEYSKKAFSRSGIPLYLCAALCPVLNKAAEEYSEIFTDGKLHLRFSVQDGEFNVDVINPVGSETVTGQSVGESAMAGIICAFALREVAPKTNLLILDEPGHGLDPKSARQFAEGLLRLKDKIGSILVVAHNPAIESVLSGEKIWTVEKSKGVSRLIQ
jgi:DNA repair exonuclease SbcCD nuclease subunit